MFWRNDVYQLLTILARGVISLSRCLNKYRKLDYWLFVCRIIPQNKLNSLKQSPSWETNSTIDWTRCFSVLWNLMAYLLHVHENIPPVPVMSFINIIHTLQPYFRKDYLNIMLSTFRSFEWTPSFRLLNSSKKTCKITLLYNLIFAVNMLLYSISFWFYMKHVGKLLAGFAHNKKVKFIELVTALHSLILKFMIKNNMFQLNNRALKNKSCFYITFL